MKKIINTSNFASVWKQMNILDNPCCRQKRTITTPTPKSSSGHTSKKEILRSTGGRYEKGKKRYSK